MSNFGGSLQSVSRKGYGGPQADGGGGNAKLFTHCQLKEVFIKLKQVSGINRKLKKKNIYPQMTQMEVRKRTVEWNVNYS